MTLEFWIRISTTGAPRDTVKHLLAASRRGTAAEAQLLLTQEYEGYYYARMGNSATMHAFASALTERRMSHCEVTGPPANMKVAPVSAPAKTPLTPAERLFGSGLRDFFASMGTPHSWR